jgi:hypothetical protein
MSQAMPKEVHLTPIGQRNLSLISKFQGTNDDASINTALAWYATFIRNQNEIERDDTTYLLQSEKMTQRLLDALADTENDLPLEAVRERIGI